MICVVSADNEIRDALAKALGTVTCCSSAQEALALGGITNYVIDLLAAGIDGAAFRGCKTPVTVVGVYGTNPTIIGPDRHLKPFTLDRLLDAVANVFVPILEGKIQLSANAA